MALSKKMEQTINDQIQEEGFSAQLYLSMSAYLESIDLPGFAHWMFIQYQEESAHMIRFFKFVNERHGRVVLKRLEQPGTEWSGPLHVFQEAFKHEEHITERINNLADLSLQEKDHATHQFLQWFIAEQVEEEKNAKAIIAQLKMAQDSKSSLYLIDKELSARVFVDPNATPALP